MKLTRKRIFLGILIFWLTTNLLILLDVQYFYLRAIFSFIFLTTIPGLLIMLMLKIRNIGFWEYLVYTIGLSIAFLMFGGLLINWTLPLIGINQSLSRNPLLISFNLLLLIFFLITYIRNQDLYYEFKFIKLSLFNWIFFLIPIIFPVLSILGAISLNNHGPNTLTMIMLGGIALYVSLIIIFRKRVNPNIYPLAIILISISLLLMTSLRGWYITGHDIKPEYHVFQLTKKNYYWSISHLHDPYNACLSITILPTIFSSFLQINDMYIYKILFQIIFSFSVVSIFLLFKRYSLKPIAFLSAFFFVSFPTFLNEMPSENRQEIALLFFTLMFLILFNKAIKPRLKEVLFLIFGFSMIVSHYSTSYVAVAVFILTYLISFVFKNNLFWLNSTFKKIIKIFKKKEKIPIHNKNYYLTGTMVLGIVVFTFLWNTQLTQTSDAFEDLIFQVYQNIGKSFSKDLKSGDVLYSIFSWQKLDKAELLNEYVQLTTKEIELRKDRDLFYEQSVYEKSPISLLDNDILPLTSLGKKLSKSIDVFSLNYYLRQGSAKVIQILLTLGFMALILKKSLYVKSIDSEYYILAFISIILLGLLILLPLFSIEYGTGRFFQQTLIILSLPTIIGSLIIFNFLNENRRLYMSLVIFVVFFLSLSGFIPQISGGYYSELHLNNQGLYYDFYYTHKSEFDSINWLANKFSDEYDILSNSSVHSKMLAFAGLYSLEKILPVTIRKDAYVYLDRSNVKKQKNIIFYKGNLIIYDYPIEFLNENKNLIYSNQGSQIFK